MRRSPTSSSQDGLTLVELVIASAIAMALLAGITTMFAQGLRSQTTTVNGDTATGRAQVVSMSLEKSLRNARKATISADGRSLAAEVLVSGSWKCQRWELVVHGTDPLQNTLTYTAGGTTSVLATGVTPSGSALFGPPGSTVEYGARVTYDLRVDIATMSAQTEGTILLQGAGTGGATC